MKQEASRFRGLALTAGAFLGFSSLGFAAAALGQGTPVVIPQSPTTTQYDTKAGFPDQNGPFSAMLVIIPKAQMAEFDGPSGGSRHLDRVARAEPGAELALKLLFTGMQGDWKGIGSVTYDLQVLDPAGKVYGSADYRGIDAFHGMVGSGEGVFDNTRVVQLVFEPTDKPGPYTIKAVMHDRVAQRDVPLQATLELLPARIATPAEPVAQPVVPDAAPAKAKPKSRRKKRHR